MDLKVLFLVSALLMGSSQVAAQATKQPSASEIQQRCEADPNCFRRNDESQTEFVANALDPELCDGRMCARHVNSNFPVDSLASTPALIRPTGSPSSPGSSPSEATQ